MEKREKRKCFLQGVDNNKWRTGVCVRYAGKEYVRAQCGKENGLWFVYGWMVACG